MERFFKFKSKSCESRTHAFSKGSTLTQKRTHVKFIPDDIIDDFGLWKPIEEYDVGTRDQVQKTYVLKGPCQPCEYDLLKK